MDYLVTIATLLRLTLRNINYGCYGNKYLGRFSRLKLKLMQENILKMVGSIQPGLKSYC